MNVPEDPHGSRPVSDPLAHLRFLSMKQASELTGYTPQHLYRMQRAGTFPQRRQLGPNRVGILWIDYQRWVATRPIADTSDEDVND